MNREWYLIDDDGIHPLDTGREPEPDDYFEQFHHDSGQAPWPPFSQLVVDASATKTVDALGRTAPELGVELQEVTEQPERWDDGLVVARAGELTALGEPDVDLDDRVMALPWTERLVEDLRCDGAFFGYDPAAATLYLTRFADGKIDFAWCDSLVPGPSYAMIFDDGGQATDEDPRTFALRRLDMPETSPLLDRYHFVTTELQRLGLEEVSPRLAELPVAAVMKARLVHDVENGT